MMCSLWRRRLRVDITVYKYLSSDKLKEGEGLFTALETAQQGAMPETKKGKN